MYQLLYQDALLLFQGIQPTLLPTIDLIKLYTLFFSRENTCVVHND